MDTLVYVIAFFLCVLLIGHKKSTKGSGYTLLQTIFFAYASKE